MMKFMEHDRLGFNYRLTDVQAAIGVAQLERLDDAARRAGRGSPAPTPSASRRSARPSPARAIPTTSSCRSATAGSERRSWFVYVLRLPADADRDGIIAELDRRGIDARPYIPCIHLSDLYRERFGTREGQFPVAEDFSRRSLALPFHPDSRRRRWSGSSPSSPDILGRPRP